VLYWDLVGGAAGDMLLASLIDAGASLERVRRTVLGLGLGHVEIHTKEARPAGLRARQIDVIIRGALADREYLPEEAAREAEAHALRVTGRAPDARPGRAPVHGGHTHPHGDHTHPHDGHTHPHDGHSAHRPYRDIRAMLERAELPARTRTLALTAFRHLAEAEALAHGVDVEQVEFHEVGADDAIADIVGVACALEELAPDEVIVSPVPIARGLTRGGHGPIPLPGPATRVVSALARLLEIVFMRLVCASNPVALTRIEEKKSISGYLRLRKWRTSASPASSSASSRPLNLTSRMTKNRS
jgi:uncharacterized protein (DUF111 family)